MRTDPLLNIPQQSSGAPDKLRRKLIYRQTEDIMGLATFALNTSPYFQYNGKLYKLLDETASVGVAGFRRCYCCSNSDTKHKGTRYYFPCSTRHSATWNIACSRLSVSGGLKKRTGDEWGLVGGGLKKRTGDEWGLVGKKERSGEPVSIVLKTLFRYTSSWYTL